MSETTSPKTGLLARIEKAIQPLAQLGLWKPEPAASPLLARLSDLSASAESRDKLLNLGRLLQQIPAFNEIVREQIGEIRSADRYEEINRLFGSIRDDARRLVGQIEDGKISVTEKAVNFLNDLTKGSTHARFEKVRSLYLDVTTDSAKALQREAAILGAYTDFRLALKEAEIVAHELLTEQQAVRDAALSALTSASSALEGLADGVEKSRAELARDEAKIVYDTADKNYQTIKSVAENLTVSYNVGEAVMARLAQTHRVKEAVYNQAVTFFTTNENVLTALDAAFTSGKGLHEGAKTIDALKEGVDESLRVLGEVTGKINESALKSAYGSTVSPAAVAAFVDAIVTHEKRSAELIATFRAEATQAATEIAKTVEDGKKAVIALAQ